MEHTGIITDRHSGRGLPLVLLLAFGVLTGLTLPLARTAATSAGVPPLAYAFWQALGAGILLCLAAARHNPTRRAPAPVRYYLLSGLTAVALPNGLAFLVVNQVGAGLTATVYAFPPLFTYLLAVGLRLERPRGRRALGIGIGVLGCLIILSPGEQGIAPRALPWMLLALLVPLSLATGNVYRSLAWPADGQPVPLAAGMLLAAALLLAPVMVFSEQLYVPGLEAGALILALQILATAIGYTLFFELQRRATPVFLSQTGYVITLTGLLLGVVLLGERHGPLVWAGTALVFAGVFVTNFQANHGR